MWYDCPFLSISSMRLPTEEATLLIERHPAVGTETSSRNSEVIHAGIYYGTDTMKTSLCVRGKNLLYELCKRHDVGFKNTGKWIVAQNDEQMTALHSIEKHCREEIGVPVRWVSQEEIAREGEGVRAEKGCLESPTTGIVDSHGLMITLQGLFEENGGVVALNSPVQRITPLGDKGASGWEVEVMDGTTGETSTVTTETIVNAAGLGAVEVHNMIVPDTDKKTLYYAKGNYFSYGSSHPKVSRLIYPAPEPGLGGLGTHLTLDLGGRLKFGPDVEWVDDPNDLSVNTSRFEQAVREIKRFLPGVDVDSLKPDYAGIRPKLAHRQAVATGKGFQDFVIRKESGYEGWVNLLGIESPGLTSSLAIGEQVEKLIERLYQDKVLALK
ncbi:L-2-hydroxyglutarate dehydrogenase-like protein [Emericellopsis cladophorae]|uniref:L-2-hydroxyglutarate dehydrogenase, mitochondrial n=1 Tax=Emericellopsis cladophorae TaxID=2686198 RepID=A0A9Q0BHI2_9HYPO|nr:L-2-hydroxyglutarate dehydrogenase-like protein [Emericellopsis cladophorae]KAI6785121.1 L-2-hydroxyglutarate dehydrogenase-like protein [Emericellopsis cladophorae]